MNADVTSHITACRQCGEQIDRAVLEQELTRIDILETAMLAARSSVFCTYRCMLEDFCSNLRPSSQQTTEKE